MRIINCKLIVFACNNLITSYSFLTIGNLVIFNNLIFAKGVPFCSKLARKGGTAQLAWKNGTPFCEKKYVQKRVFCCCSSS